MVEPLSKRAQLFSPSIQTWAMFSGLLHWLSGRGFKKGPFWDIFRLWELCPGSPVEWLLVSEESSLPSLSSPLLCLNLLFWQSCWDPLDNLSQDGQDYHIWNNFSFSSGTAWLHWQNGCYNWLADLLHQSHSRFLKTQPLFPLLALHLNPSVPMLSTMADQAVKVWLPFSFLDGNKFPDLCGWVTMDPLVVMVFGSRGSLASAHLSNICAARSKS